MKAFIETYGCTANHADSAAMRDSLIISGWSVVDSAEQADVVIINTCAVTGHTARSMLKAASRHRGNGKRVIVAGCLTAAEPGMLDGLEHAGAAGPCALSSLLSLSPPCGEIPLTMLGQTAVIPIASGCAGECSYCIVKSIRGKLRSYPVEAVTGAIRRALKAGASEIFLTAQDTGAYGMDTGVRLPDLISAVTAIPGGHKVRLGMMNPFTLADILPRMIDALSHPRMYRFAHIPVQSGSDRILKLMNRPYTGSGYEAIINQLKEGVPRMTFSTDYIVGFPTESGDDHMMTMDNLRKTRPLKVNITRYSPRPGTIAASMPDTLERVKKERSRSLTSLHHEVTSSYMKSMIGERMQVMVTEVKKPGSVIARDASYNMVVIKESIPPGTTTDVHIVGAGTTYMIGKIAQ